MQKLEKFTPDSKQRHLEPAYPSHASNRCPRCRQKKTVVKHFNARFCLACNTAWEHMYNTAATRFYRQHFFGKEKS